MELDTGTKAMNQVEFLIQLKISDDAVVANESMFLLTILEKNQRNKIKMFSTKCNSFTKVGKLSKSES